MAIKRMASDVKSEKLAQELKDLETHGDDELKDHWHILYGTKPPQKIHRSLLIAAVAHRMQENALGAVKPSARRQLMQVVINPANRRPSPCYPSHVQEPEPCWCATGAESPIRRRCLKTASSFAANDTSHFPR